MMPTQSVPFLTPEQYLEIERAAETRSEYLGGSMYSMAGSTLNHAPIVNNAGLFLNTQLRGRECTAFATDLRLFVRRHDLITYPDVFVACRPFQMLEGRRDTMVDATVIVEVLSVSTKNYDRGEKFLFYRALPSFREYLVLAQDEIRAEHHVRQSDGSWLMREYSASTDEIELKSIGCRLRLRDVYECVEFEALPQPPAPSV
jgi:Uma2 family endonuclease